MKRLFQKCLRALKFFKACYENRVLVGSILKSGNKGFLEIGSFYSPLPDLAEVQAHSSRLFDRSYREIPGIDLKEQSQKELLDELAEFQKPMPFPDGPSVDFLFYLDNSYFGYGDAVVFFGFLRKFQPKRIIEIGGGHSTALMLDFNRLFSEVRTRLTCIEPFPERLQNLVGAEEFDRLEVFAERVQDVDPSLFDSLKENDILFVDSSHVARIGSDVLYIVLEVLPRLKKGVLVHFHDVMWPFQYPESWLMAGRAWNEAYFVRAFLQYNEAFEIVFFNSFMALHHREQMARTLPTALRANSNELTVANSSLWLRKVR